MKFFTTTVSVLSAIFLITQQANAQAHVHGQGKMLIAQEKNRWHVEIRLPAADALGFDHEANSPAQHQVKSSFADKLRHNEQVIKMHGQCALTNVSQNIAESSENQQPDKDADLHQHEHHQEMSHSHNEEDHHSDEHHDVEVQYQFLCDGQVSGIEILLFEAVPSLHAIQAQWVIKQGQGAREVSSAQPELRW